MKMKNINKLTREERARYTKNPIIVINVSIVEPKTEGMIEREFDRKWEETLKERHYLEKHSPTDVCVFEMSSYIGGSTLCVYVKTWENCPVKL